MSISNDNEFKKIFFRLEQDEDGYPSSTVEGLWAKATDDSYIIDNTPFYIYDIAPGDTVSALSIGDELWFESVKKSAGSSVFRAIVTNRDTIGELRSALMTLGCPSEANQVIGIIAIEIPQATQIGPVLDYLMEQQAQGNLDFEEGVLRHALP